MPRKTIKNIITSEERTKKINKKNLSLMERFLKEKSMRTSDTTIKVYRSNLLIFFTWNLLHNDNKFFTEIKKLEFSDFFSFVVEELQVGSSKFNNFRSTLSSLSQFIEKFYDDDYPDFRNIILNIIESAPKERRREKTVLTDEQVEDLLDHLVRSSKTQEACWVALAITSGARFSELLDWETTLIDENRTAFGDIFLETTRQIKTKGRGKSGKLLYKYILKDKFMPFYHAWMKEREEILSKNNIGHPKLFVKADGTPAVDATIRQWIEDFEGFLAVPVYPHAFRHYLTTLLSRKNIPPPLIKEIFGWSSLEMVQVYDDSSLKDRDHPELENLKGI